ncbi:hypothetical protein, partial [Porphyromonas sp.]|uniref:hypothetical protein n=1 Tax=Porphyromonas sp. TaxID=1924944 RepID=UPI00257E0DC9
SIPRHPITLYVYRGSLHKAKSALHWDTPGDIERHICDNAIAESVFYLSLPLIKDNIKRIALYKRKH